MQRRGQAALEFLSTYGFAFLIILVMVGALTYFGVLKPQNIIPERCILGREFECNDFQLQRGIAPAGNAVLRLQIVNQLGNSVTICSGAVGEHASCLPLAPNYFEIKSTGSGCTRACTTSFGANPATIAGGEGLTLTCDMTLADTCAALSTAVFPAIGEKIKTAVKFNYVELGGAFPHVVQGEVLATLQ